MKILTNEMRGSRKGPEDWFTGTVWLDEIIAAGPSRSKAIRVSFEPRARTAWHSHPLGQTLHVVAGLGRVQIKGQPPREIHPGDTVWIEPDEVHWHGAASGHTMVHLAMQQADEHGVDVHWLEKVSDEEYSVSWT